MTPRRLVVLSAAVAAVVLSAAVPAATAFVTTAGRLSKSPSPRMHLAPRRPRSVSVGAVSLRASEEVDLEVGAKELLERDFALKPLGGVNLLERNIMDPLGVDSAPPAEEENMRFACDASVGKWRNFMAAGPSTDVEENLRAAAAIPVKYATASPQAALYWAGHLARTSYFAVNAIAGSTAFSIAQAISSGDVTPPPVLPIDNAAASRMVLEAMMTYEQDWLSVAGGDFKAPWDMTTIGHRQHNPLFALRQTLRFANEAVGTLSRRKSDAPKGVWLSAPKLGYPEYYMNNFHYQGDGWFSSESAEVYETSTETLFLGKQDAMQRMTLLPFKNATPKTILEVACGTGRFGTFIRDNHPTALMTSVDLSPFYLQKARDNDDYWVRQQPAAAKPKPASFVQAAAEDLPFADNSFDAVACVYLFHEMPCEARAKALAEMARVLAPGGILSLTDSVQIGDRPGMDKNLGGFTKMNEPHYANYISTDIGGLFQQAGLVASEKWLCSSTKTLSFTKPASQ